MDRSDVPLLDEAAELLGEIDEQVLRASALQAEEELAARRRRRSTSARPSSPTPARSLELTGLSDIMDAERLADRHRGDGAYLPPPSGRPPTATGPTAT